MESDWLEEAWIIWAFATLFKDGYPCALCPLVSVRMASEMGGDQ